MATAITSQKPERRVEKKGVVTKVGNLTEEPKLRFAPSGVAVVSAGLAVDHPKVAGDWAGERTTDFYQLIAFGTLGEHVAESLAKGTRVVVTGNAEVEHWTGKDGEERTTKQIIADAVGPDLRWATAKVERTGKAQAPTSNGPKAQEEDGDEPF